MKPVRFSSRKVYLLFTAFLAACATVQTTQQGAIGVDRKQYMVVSEEAVEKSAATAYAEALDGAVKKGELNVDAAQTARVKTIANRLIPHTAAFRPDAVKWDWQINVQKTADVNAYCMPGGKIMVYTGLIEKLNATDAELAAVIGHEIAHALREHTRERVSRLYVQQVGLGVLAALSGASDTAVQLASQITTVTFTLPHSREQEAEADRIGLELMARAGYNPEAAVSLWQKMGQLNDSKTPAFLSTHPASADREQELKRTIPKVQSLYEAADKP
jgi:predicted Zn-dependent protease